MQSRRTSIYARRSETAVGVRVGMISGLVQQGEMDGCAELEQAEEEVGKESDRVMLTQDQPDGTK